MLLLMHLGLLVVAFVFQLVELTSGAKRRRHLHALGFLWVFLVAVVFVRVGWRAGLASCVLSWVYVSALRPLAARLAARAMSIDSGGGGAYPGLPSADLLKLSRVLGRHLSPEEMLRELRSDVSARDSALNSLAKKLGDGLADLGFSGTFNYANCAAQLVRADIAMEQPFEIVFAGPAAGTVASAHFGKLIDRGDLLCVDVGGTSCDISMVTAGQPYVNTTFLLEHDLIVNALSNEVESIGAGGGSLVTISSAGEVLVGPGSAGADPGPACYGKGGTQPASTDTLVLMGVIDPSTFAGGRMSLDPDLSRQAFENLDTTLPFDQRVSYAFNIGINNVAEGITNIAIKHGIDARDYSLVAFGAAGPMLLPATMDLVHAREVIVPPHPGLFSALGLVSSDQVYGDSRSSYTMLGTEAVESVNKVYQQMEDKLRERFDDKAPDIEFVRSMDARLAGQTWETPFVSVPSGEITPEKMDEMIANFHDVYDATGYGLAASVWTQRLDRAHRVAAELHAGIVWINTWMLRDLRTPFGGVGQSGLGREGGMEAMRFFTEPKNVCVQL